MFVRNRSMSSDYASIDHKILFIRFEVPQVRVDFRELFVIDDSLNGGVMPACVRPEAPIMAWIAEPCTIDYDLGPIFPEVGKVCLERSYEFFLCFRVLVKVVRLNIVVALPVRKLGA